MCVCVCVCVLGVCVCVPFAYFACRSVPFTLLLRFIHATASLLLQQSLAFASLFVNSLGFVFFIIIIIF